MKVRCLNCGLVLEKCLSLKCVCPECGVSNWGICINPEDTMMGLTMKARDKSDRESLEIMLETYNMAKNWLEEKGYITFEKMGVPENPYLPKDYKKRVDAFQYRKDKKEEGLAFEIFEYFNGNKIQVRKIYFDGHIEGFKGDPCIINHAYPKFLKFKAVIVDMIRQINEDYMRLAERHIMADMPIAKELDYLKKAYLERINNIKI